MGEDKVKRLPIVQRVYFSLNPVFFPYENLTISLNWAWFAKSKVSKLISSESNCRGRGKKVTWIYKVGEGN